MAKGKLKVNEADLAALKLGAELYEVDINDLKQIGDVVIVECAFKQASNLFELGRSIDKIKTQK